MCGRYAIQDFEELSETLRGIQLRFDSVPRDTWNAAPTQLLPVFVEEDEAWALREMHWGLIPKWTKPGTKPKVTPFNARSETAAEKPMFKGLLRYSRCIVPASGFFEWKKDGSTKRPHYIHPADGQFMLMAGLFDTAETESGPLQSFTIMTTNANKQMEDLHDRMPVILNVDASKEWISREETEVGPVSQLLQPLPEGELDIYEVSRDMNSARHNSPDNILPLDSEAQ